MTSALRVGSEKPASAAYPAATAMPATAPRRTGATPGTSHGPAKRPTANPSPAASPMCRPEIREEMGGAGPAQGLALVSGDPVADPHHEGLDEGAGRADLRELAKPPGRARGGYVPGRGGPAAANLRTLGSRARTYPCPA